MLHLVYQLNALSELIQTLDEHLKLLTIFACGHPLFYGCPFHALLYEQTPFILPIKSIVLIITTLK
jgi:hypothetical protein